MSSESPVRSFRVPERLDLADLHDRLRRTRYAVASPGEEWAAGTSPRFLSRLVDRWLHGYDWMRAARRLNRYPHAIASIRGCELHFVRAARPGAPAVVLLHGWPYTFAEMLPLVDRLAPDFEVVVPSLPGFAYSGVLPEPFGEVALTELVQELMTETLGHARFITYGEDVGSWVSDRLAGTHPDAVAGIAVTHPALPPPEVRGDLGPETVAFFDRLAERWEGERGYSVEQATKPDTLAAAVGDSPAGLAAWIIEKFRTWSDCDGGSNPSSPSTT